MESSQSGERKNRVTGCAKEKSRSVFFLIFLDRLALTARTFLPWHGTQNIHNRRAIEGRKKRKAHNRKQNKFASRTIAELRHGEHCTQKGNRRALRSARGGGRKGGAFGRMGPRKPPLFGFHGRRRINERGDSRLLRARRGVDTYSLQRREQGKKVQARHHEMLGVLPTLGHMALLGLQQAGHLKHLISTNTGGLHLRSGFPSTHFVELRGNASGKGYPAQPVGNVDDAHGGGGCGKIEFRNGRCRNKRLERHQGLPRG